MYCIVDNWISNATIPGTVRLWSIEPLILSLSPPTTNTWSPIGAKYQYM